MKQAAGKPMRRGKQSVVAAFSSPVEISIAEAIELGLIDEDQTYGVIIGKPSAGPLLPATSVRPFKKKGRGDQEYLHSQQYGSRKEQFMRMLQQEFDRDANFVMGGKGYQS